MEAVKIWFDDQKIYLQTQDGRKASMPLAWFPRLANATQTQRDNYKLSAFGIHWEELDEDLSFEGFFRYEKDNLKV